MKITFTAITYEKWEGPRPFQEGMLHITWFWESLHHSKHMITLNLSTCDLFFAVLAIAHHVSWLLNFFVTTLPNSIPSRSTIFCARSGCDVPLNTLMLGILVSRIGTVSKLKKLMSLMQLTTGSGNLPFQRMRRVLARGCQVLLSDTNLPP